MSSISSVNSSSENSSEEVTKRQKPKWQEHVTEDWLEQVTQSRRYNLTLNGLQFCRSWTLPDCFRDLIQNATDSMYAVHKKHHKCKKPRVVLDTPLDSWDKTKDTVAKIFLECEKGGRTDPVGYFVWTTQADKYDGPIISIINLGANFPSEALTIGISTKSENDAGGHGEGLKAAITAAIRAKVAFEIFQSGVSIKFEESEDKDVVIYKVASPIHKALQFKPLTKLLTKTLGASVQNDVIVHVGNTPDLQFEDFQDAARRFLFLTHRHPNSLEIGALAVVNRKETKSGRAILLGEEFAGKVYAVSIYFKTNEGFQRSYGVDFIKSDALCRDRNEISHSKYLWAMGELISELLEEDPQFANVILKEFKQAECDPKVVQHLEQLPTCASRKAKQSVIDAYKRNPENADIKYIVSGTSSHHLTDNAIVPMWCDVQACRVVPPLLFGLISEGYPSLEEIKRETSDKLAACPYLNEHARELQTWIRERNEFFLFKDSELFQRLVNQIEVRQTANMLDVPFYIIKEHPAQGHLPQIIFSERALGLKLIQPRKFLDLAVTALSEAAAPYLIKLVVQKPSLKIKIKLPQSGSETRSKDVSPTSKNIEGPEPVALPAYNGWDFESDFVMPNILSKNSIKDNDDSEIEMLEKCLTESVSFGNYAILCTRDAYNQWTRLVQEKKMHLESLTNQSINACSEALQKLADSASFAGCKLAFYIAPDSNIQGYSSEPVGIRINLRSVLLEVARGNLVEESALMAYFDVLIAHEYAHYVKSEDAHSPEHGARTEYNMQNLLQEAYKSNKVLK